MAVVSHECANNWSVGLIQPASRYSSFEAPAVLRHGGNLLQPLPHGQVMRTVRVREAAAASGGATTGDYPVNSHEIIISPLSIYEVLELLGRGTFGQVLRCWKKDTNEVVAMKILKNLPSYTKQGQVEVEVLTRLSKVDSEQFNFINLYDYLKRNRFQPLPLQHIRPVAQQVMTCLKKLRELGLVHADLKPENIMLVDPDRQPFRVKVIDFGSATCHYTGLSSTYLQSRYYRAPEVILGAAYDEAIDMWSLGCVLAELFLGWPLFPGATEYDQISYISQMLGDPPTTLTKNVEKMSKFYSRDNRRKWLLKPQAQYQLETGICPKETRKFIFTSVTAIGQVSTCTQQHLEPSLTGLSQVAEHLDKLQFIALLEILLSFDPKQRADPSTCLQHPFITMLHLAMQTASPCVRDWIECMQVCCHSRTTHSSPPHVTTHPTITHQPYTNHRTHLPLIPLLTEYYGSTFSHATVSPSHGPCPSNSSLLVDTGYVSADSSPTLALDGPGKVEFLRQQSYPFVLSRMHSSPYWQLMLQHSNLQANHSRL